MFNVFSASYGKTLNIATGAILLTATPILLSQSDVNRAVRARISNSAQAVRVSIATSAGVTDGIFYPANSVIIVEGANNIRAMTIRAIADGAIVNIELEG